MCSSALQNNVDERFQCSIIAQTLPVMSRNFRLDSHPSAPLIRPTSTELQSRGCCENLHQNLMHSIPSSGTRMRSRTVILCGSPYECRTSDPQFIIRNSISLQVPAAAYNWNMLRICDTRPTQSCACLTKNHSIHSFSPVTGIQEPPRVLVNPEIWILHSSCR
jgi:hypothetical protein